MAVGFAVVAHVLFERVAVADVGAVNVVQDEVGDCQEMRQRFFFHAVEAGVEGGAVLYGFDLRLDVVERRDEKAAGAAGEIRHAFAEDGRNHLHHEVGNGARGVELAGVARALQAFQDGFVDFAEGVALFAAVKIYGVDFVDDFAQLYAVFHEVFGICKDVAHDALAQRGLFVDAQVF